MHPIIPLQKGQEITVTIEDLVYGGEGHTRFPGYDVLVPRGLPGDRLLVRIFSVQAETVRADIVRVIIPSADRIPPICPAFQAGCGACQWLHMAYDAQLLWKRRLVESLIGAHPVLLNVSILNTIGMQRPFFYRNKMVTRIRGTGDMLRVGFQNARGWVLDVFDREDGQCYIQQPMNNRLGRALAAVLQRERRPLKSATIRSSDEGEVALDLERKLAPSLSADLQGIGRQSLTVHYTVRKKRFQVTSPAFFQANTRQTEALVDAVLGLLPEGRLRVAVDVYCGVGLFTLFLADRTDTVYGVEESQVAIRDAERNAAEIGAENLTFVCEKAETALPEINRQNGQIDVILLDPPRSGCHRTVLEAVSQCKPRTLIYVSCNVTSLARDLAILHELGLPARTIQPVDMFPHSYHIECVAQCTAE